MQITVTTHDSIVVIEAAGAIDAKGAGAFEKQVLGHLTANTQQAIIDLAKVDVLTSHGIRVLMLIVQRLEALDGALVLCALSDQLRNTFEVAGLSQRFRFCATQAEALAAFSASASGPRAPARHLSKLTRLTRRLLADSDDTVRVGAKDPAPTADYAELARQVATLLATGKSS